MWHGAEFRVWSNIFTFKRFRILVQWQGFYNVDGEPFSDRCGGPHIGHELAVNTIH